MPRPIVARALERLTEHVMSMPGVAGTAQGLCGRRRCLKVLVTKKTRAGIRRIPQVFEGYPVVIEETGRLRALR